MWRKTVIWEVKKITENFPLSRQGKKNLFPLLGILAAFLQMYSTDLEKNLDRLEMGYQNFF